MFFMHRLHRIEIMETTVVVRDLYGAVYQYEFSYDRSMAEFSVEQEACGRRASK